MTIDVDIRDLTTIDEFRQVVALEQAIWGYTDAADLVTVPVFIFTVHRGATLLGAVDPSTSPGPRGAADPMSLRTGPSTPTGPRDAADPSSLRAGPGRIVGFAYAVMGMKDRRPMQWSHMAGVLPEYRGGLGYRLKLAQRERALSQGLDLIEWTFDPLQAMNAHFNFAKLGCVADEYAANFYGESTSALHRGTPTDRLVASWRIAEAHVVRRLEQSTALRARAHDVSAAPIVNPTSLDGQWRKVDSIDLSRDDRRVWIEIPTGFTEMQQQAPDRALQWRMDLREMFEAYFAKGFRAVDFVLQRENGFGRYLLARGPGSPG
jgi:predicted GNAT superfamily acetyltransferase